MSLGSVKILYGGRRQFGGLKKRQIEMKNENCKVQNANFEEMGGQNILKRLFPLPRE
jgi:hypothetical protein